MGSNKYKTLLLFAIKDKSGSLCDVLNIFKKYSVNLSKIVSRPHPTKEWQYIFLMELEGNYHETKIQKALKEFKKITLDNHILGTYPTKII